MNGRTPAEVVHAICRRLEVGEHVDDATKAENISWPTLLKLKAEDPALEAEYRRALSAGADLYFARAIRAAEEATQENAQAARLRFEAYRWAAMVKDRERYGDLKRTESGGAVTIRVVRGGDDTPQLPATRTFALARPVETVVEPCADEVAVVDSAES